MSLSEKLSHQFHGLILPQPLHCAHTFISHRIGTTEQLWSLISEQIRTLRSEYAWIIDLRYNSRDHSTLGCSHRGIPMPNTKLRAFEECWGANTEQVPTS